MHLSKLFFGEFLGTFILVFIGCSTVALSVLGIALPNLLEVALVWGVGVALAIYISRKFCPAHLNPAVSFALFLDKKINPLTLMYFIFFQLLGAILAGALVYLIFNPAITAFEFNHSIIRGGINSQQTAKIFGEFFPNPGSEITDVSLFKAMLAEGLGTFGLMMVIFTIGKTRRKVDKIAPALIGLTVTILIIIIAPYTQGGFNPARDFGPRLIAYFSGWESVAFPTIPYSFLTVYIIAPFLGATLAFLFFKILIKKSSNSD